MAGNAQKTKGQQNDRKTDNQTASYLDHGVPSSVAMDNPDDSQLGADRTQSKDGKQG